MNKNFLLILFFVFLFILSFFKVQENNQNIEQEIDPNSYRFRLYITRPLSLGTSSDIHHLHLGEVWVFKTDGTKLKLQCRDPCMNKMGPHDTATPNKAIDGDITTIFSSNPDTYGTEDHYLDYSITNINQLSDIHKIKIYITHPQHRRIEHNVIRILDNNEIIWQDVFKGIKNEHEFIINPYQGEFIDNQEICPSGRVYVDSEYLTMNELESNDECFEKCLTDSNCDYALINPINNKCYHYNTAKNTKLLCDPFLQSNFYGKVKTSVELDNNIIEYPNLRYPPNLTNIDTNIVGNEQVSSDINNPTIINVSGLPYGNGEYGFVSGPANLTASRNLLTLFKGYSGYLQTALDSANFNPFNDTLTDNKSLVIGIFYPTPIQIFKLDIRCIHLHRKVLNIIIRASNTLDLESFEKIATIDTKDIITDGLIKTIRFDNNNSYKYYFYTFNDGDTEAVEDLDIFVFNPYGYTAEKLIRYPPIGLTENTQVLENLPYGNGEYKARVNGNILDTDPVRNPFNAFSHTREVYMTTDAYNTEGTDLGDEFNITTDTVISGEEDYIINLNDKTGTGIDIEFPEPTTITHYGIRSREGTGTHIIPPSRWQLIGSNDGTTWTDILDDKTNEKHSIDYNNDSFTLIGGNYFKITNPANYKFYRLFVTSFIKTLNQDNIGFKIGEIELFNQEE